jgi:hypothetical protein
MSRLAERRHPIHHAFGRKDDVVPLADLALAGAVVAVRQRTRAKLPAPDRGLAGAGVADEVAGRRARRAGRRWRTACGPR